MPKDQEDLHLTKFPGQNVFPTWFCRSAKPLVGITTWGLQMGTQPAKTHVVVVASLCPFSITVRYSVVEPHWFPCNPFGVRADQVVLQIDPNAGGGELLSPYGLFYPLEEPEVRGRHNCVVVDCLGGRTMQSACSHFSYPSNVVCLGL